MTNKSIFALVAVLCVGSFTTIASGQSRRPLYEVVRVATPVKIDGKLDDVSWSKAERIDNFVTNLDGSLGSQRTEARMLYDDSFIYFSFRCVDDNIWATYKRRDEHLWNEEVVEVFVQADLQQHSYIELEVNPLGTMLDIFMLDVRKPLHYESWNSEKLKWAVQLKGTTDGKSGDQEWTCEIALPMEDIVTAPHIPARPGDHWRVNLCRVEQKPTPTLLAWSPTFKDDFHLPEMFGEIVFSDRRAK